MRTERKRIPDERRDEILDELENTNLPISTLAKKHNVSTKSIYKWRKDRGMQQNSSARNAPTGFTELEAIGNHTLEQALEPSNSNSSNNNHNNLLSIKLKFREFSILVEGNIKQTILTELTRLASMH